MRFALARHAPLGTGDKDRVTVKQRSKRDIGNASMRSQTHTQGERDRDGDRERERERELC